MPKLQKTLEQMTEMGVISKVNKATDWVNTLGIVEKKRWFIKTLFRSKRFKQINQERTLQASHSWNNIQQTK